MKPIHFHLYDPTAHSLFKTKANDKAESHSIHCSNSENCALFARGECVLRELFVSANGCAYGSLSISMGPTKRAKGFSKWVAEQRKKYEGVGELSWPTKRMAIVGDNVFLPYAHMNMNHSVPFLKHHMFFSNGSHFMPLRSFTLDVVLNMLDFRPKAMMGGEITEYQKTEIPTFLTHLKEEMPDMYAMVIKARPDKEGVMRSNIGRKAYIHSLRPGVVVTKYHNEKSLRTQHWKWDGEYLISDDAGLSFAIVAFDECVIRLKPKQGETVEIVSDDQVDEATRYKD